ncbi:hypothetical protein BgiMline_021892, partial [Biomphalaria glabrata]
TPLDVRIFRAKTYTVPNHIAPKHLTPKRLASKRPELNGRAKSTRAALVYSLQ